MFGPDQFNGLLLTAAQDVLPWVAGGAAAGLAVLGVLLGIRAGIIALRNLAEDRASNDQMIAFYAEREKEYDSWD